MSAAKLRLINHQRVFITTFFLFVLDPNSHTLRSDDCAEKSDFPYVCYPPFLLWFVIHWSEPTSPPKFRLYTDKNVFFKVFASFAYFLCSNQTNTKEFRSVETSGNVFECYHNLMTRRFPFYHGAHQPALLPKHLN